MSTAGHPYIEAFQVARNKPVILVAHSFGGLVALKAVSLAYHHPEGWPGIFECFAGIHFFGTPFRGAPGLSYSETLGAAYEVLEPDLVEPRMLEILQRGNETLTELVDDFCRIWSHHRSGRIACFYELHASEVGNIVGEVEGCLDLWRGVSKHALAKNHFNMNKFASPDESEFRLIGRIMKETVQNAMPPQLPPRRTSANTDSTNLGTAENPATQSQSTLDRLWLLNFPNAKVSKVCYECKRDSRPKEDLWLPCPLHCSDCPRSTDMNWREALKGKSLLSLTGFEDLCIVHQEAKKHIERQKRERKELERLIALQAPRPAPIYNAGGFSQAYQSQRTNDLLRDIKRNQDQARLVPSLQGSHLRPSRNANASSPKPFTFGGGSGLSGSTPQVLARTYSPQTQAQQFSNMLDRYNTLHQQTMMENMEMQKAQAFWNPLDSMSKRGATS